MIALRSATYFALLDSLNLRTASGGAFDPTAYAQLRTWLLNATATNMAYMLSAQLAAMELNVTVAQDATRSYQEALKNALDSANNNKTFVQPCPASCPAPAFTPCVAP